MSLRFGLHKVIDQGKMIKDSKRAHMWIVFKDEQKYEIIAKESFVSKKFRFYVDRKLIAEFKTSEENKKRGFDFEAKGMYFHVRKVGSARFSLFVDNVEFKPNDSVTDKIAKKNIKRINEAMGGIKAENPQIQQKIKQGSINKNIELNLNQESSGEENFDDFGKKDFGTNMSKNPYGKFDPDSDDDQPQRNQNQQYGQQGFGNFGNKQQKNLNDDFGNDFLNFESNNNQQQSSQNQFGNFNQQKQQDQFGFGQNNDFGFGSNNNNNNQFGFDNSNNQKNNNQFGFDNNKNNNQFGFGSNHNQNNDQFGFDNNNDFGFDNNNNNNDFGFDNKNDFGFDNKNDFGFGQQKQKNDDFLKFGDDDFNLKSDNNKQQQGFNFDNRNNQNNGFF